MEGEPGTQSAVPLRTRIFAFAGAARTSGFRRNRRAHARSRRATASRMD